MRKLIEQRISDAAFIADQGHQYAYLLSTLRCLLQGAAYSSFELAALGLEERDGLSEVARSLLQPSDGNLIAAIDAAIPVIRDAWPGCCQGWFETRRSGSEPGRSLALAIVAQRNDRLGHGVVDEATIQRELSHLPRNVMSLAEILSDVLPSIDVTRKKSWGYLDSPIGRVNVTAIQTSGDKVVVVRKIERRGSVWRLRGQTLDHQRSDGVVIEISDDSSLVQALGETSVSELVARNVAMPTGIWRTSVVLPVRQTDVFEGRGEERGKLLDWWDDKDSRACLVYGEGGIGKTTLTLQFLNDVLDDPPGDLGWQPEVFYFFSAKQTRWGISGLEFLKGVVSNVNEAVRNIARLVEPKLDKSWFVEDTRSLVDRTAQLLSAAGLNRDSLLIVLDNTETLARNTADEAEIGKAIRIISTKLGKVIVTSRRREVLEATPIQVQPLEEGAGARLLERLGSAYEATAIVQAGDARRRKVSRQLSGKPILLDVLTRHIANAGCSIDEGMRSILKYEREDLGVFLFGDAWGRIQNEYREVFLIIGQLGGAASDKIVGWACAECGAQVSDWLSAFEETKFGSLNDYGSHFDIILETGAREFLVNQFDALDAGGKQRILSAAGKVRSQHTRFLQATDEKVTDRVAAAFRTAAAKAAKLAADRGEMDEAIMWFEEAIVSDSQNAALFDRFAWYLMVKGKLDRAGQVAETACKLAPRDPDALFTSGMIYARKGLVEQADENLLKAREVGKARHLVALQRARARIERVTKDLAEPRDRLVLLHDADELLEGSEPPSHDTVGAAKHERERARLRSWSRLLRSRKSR